MDNFTLEQLYYLCEIVAVIAIVASLVYVGKQLHQTYASMRVSAATAHAQWVFDIHFSFLGSRELAECWVKGNVDFDSLDEVDKQRLIWLEAAAINSWHQLFHLRQHQLLSDDRWYYQLWVIRHIGQRQAMQEAWKQFEDAYDQPFREFMDKHLK